MGHRRAARRHPRLGRARLPEAGEPPHHHRAAPPQRELAAINQRLDALVEERTTNLLDGLVSALDMRDSETQWHSRRVGRYARRLAEELGIAGRELDDIERGATLHDIGKIGVRDAVLLKPGRWTSRSGSR